MENKTQSLSIPAIEVKITGCEHPTWWYATKQGQTFKVYPLWKLSHGGRVGVFFKNGFLTQNVYVIQEDFDQGRGWPWRAIYQNDCVVLNKNILIKWEQL